jgi:hypothetical protein
MRSSNITLAIPVRRVIFEQKKKLTRTELRKIETTPVFTTKFIRFIEYVTNKRVYIEMMPNVLYSLSAVEVSQFSIWSKSFAHYKRIFPTIFLDEMIQVF